MRSTGLQVIVRGAGTSSGAHDAAAVCIFESYTPRSSPAFDPTAASQSVHGIARMIQVGDQTVLDLVLRSDRLDDASPRRRYVAHIARSGDISEGAASTGAVLRELGTLDLDKAGGAASLFVEVEGLVLSEVVGRSMVVSALEDEQEQPSAGTGILAGVIARSAGAWGSGGSSNDKTVCSCSGQTMWEEARLSANL